MLSLLATDASAFFFSSEENKNFSDKTDFLQFCIWVTFDEHADTLTSGCSVVLAAPFVEQCQHLQRKINAKCHVIEKMCKIT